MFALVDCNNFYASCERVFRPDLRDRPVVVLSNNDGCIIARSKEAKALGIKMGAPFFQVREQLAEQGVVCFSSNYALYADMSSRVMGILEQEAPRVEIYSIDEAFLDLSGIEGCCDLTEFGRQVKAKVDQCTGITVGIGIAPTKTLAKLANHAAKRYPATGSVVNLMDSARQRRLMALVDVAEVWGVGRRLVKKLNQRGIFTALDLADANPKMLRSEYSVVLERTIQELNGWSCLALEQVPPTKQQIVASRSFGERITDQASLRQAITMHISRAGEKLRAEQQLAKVLQVFIRTGAFNEHDPYYANALSCELPTPTDDTRVLQKAADELLSKLYRAGYRYAKAGVMLTDFYQYNTLQADLFYDASSHAKAQTLMGVMDQINQSGRGQLYLAAQGHEQHWAMKRERLSPAYTTDWQSLPLVR
ncbi:translesion error-prone DNA polymerase V subunit UmuC [Marinomonas ostreistagni]|nr:translesion error-prone DNA polymerase V subunit UmuC [Marinomonas ostreistagni]